MSKTIHTILAFMTGNLGLIDHGFAFKARDGSPLHYFEDSNGKVYVGKHKWSPIKMMVNQSISEIREMEELFPETF